MPELKMLKFARELSKHHDYTGPKLREAIPYLNQFSSKKIVLKLGGSILNDMKNLPYLIEDVVFLKKVGVSLVLVHGGSRQLSAELDKKDVDFEIKNGLRVTTPEILELAAGVFHSISLEINKEIEKHGYKSVIYDRNSGFVKSKQFDKNYGLVGEPESVEVSFVDTLADDVVPIVSSVTAGTEPRDIGFNVNADAVAGIVASEMKAEKLILMTDVDGVKDQNEELLSSLTVGQAEVLLKTGVITNGMIPKVETCLKALRNGVHKSHIIKGDNNSFIDEILTDNGVGTEFIMDNQVEIRAVS